MKKTSNILILLLAIILYSCQSDDINIEMSSGNSRALTTTRATSPTFYLGADLSYTNELEDTGVEYLVNDTVTDIFSLFHQ